MSVVQGLLFGLAMMFFIGPVFFYLLQISLEHGTRSGISAAIGIVMSDAAVIILCYFWASKLFENGTKQNEFWLAVVGGAILVVFGLGYIFKPKLPGTTVRVKKKRDYVTFFTKAFLINFVNPFVFMVWIAMIGKAKLSYDTEYKVVMFLCAALLGIITTDTLKVFGSKYLRRVIEPHFLIKLYKGIGILLIAFSLRLFYHAYYL
ncbi:MAG: LysE family transporter [Bacteroidetes bacterium]|jgi:threonine/homoserine/homoserine lactone efflux protein|nr:LysE family transporter [Bacteroidota bacterium]